MSGFDFSTLITDRTNADVSALSALLSKKLESWTPEEVEKFNNGQLKGGYWWTDLNRVTACMEYLDAEIRSLGYESVYTPVKIVRPPIQDESVLPDGYTELTYIESSGDQYINTNIFATHNSSIKAKISFLGSPGENILGARNSSSDKINRVGIVSFGATKKMGCFFGQFSTQKIPVDKNAHEYELNKNEIVVDGDTNQVSTQSFSVSYPLILFGFNDGENGVVKTRSRVWYFEMDGIKLIPCKDKYSEVGMYDIKNKNFIKNSGSGSFLPGEEVFPAQKPNPLDPYTWYNEDSPTLSQMEQYLSNVAALRSVFELQEHAPQTPKSMSLLTFAKANDIESVLKEVENVIILIISSFWYSGEIYSGEV